MCVLLWQQMLLYFLLPFAIGAKTDTYYERDSTGTLTWNLLTRTGYSVALAMNKALVDTLLI